MRFELTESRGVYPSASNVGSVENVGTLFIKPDGYGDLGSEDGYGCPVLLERYDGRLRLVVWANINQEDPTHIIDLEGAREDKRDKEDDPTNPNYQLSCNPCTDYYQLDDAKVKV